MNALLNTAVCEPGTRDIIITRLLNAPRQLVWDAWTHSEHVDKWWGPTGFSTRTTEKNVKPGGVWNFVMHGPDGHDYLNKITYQEVTEPERLKYRHAGDGDFYFEVEVTFEAHGNQTLLTLHSTFESVEVRDTLVREVGAVEGGIQTLTRFEAFLAEMA